MTKLARVKTQGTAWQLLHWTLWALSGTATWIRQGCATTINVADCWISCHQLLSYYCFDRDRDHFTPPAFNNPLGLKTLSVHVGGLSLCHMRLSVLFWKSLRPRVESIRATWLPTPESTGIRWNSQNLRNTCLCILRTIQSVINDLQGSSPSTHT